MPAQAIFPHPTDNGISQIINFPAKAAEAWLPGAAVLTDSNGELVECADDPAALVGFALAAPFKNPGYDMANSPTVVTGRDAFVPVAVARPGVIFVGRGVNGGTDPVTPTQAMVNNQYELIGNGAVWAVNIGGTSSPCVEIVRVDIDNKLFFFRVIPANIQG